MTKSDGCHRIALPTSFRLHTMKAVLEHLNFFPEEKPAHFELSFNAAYDFFDPPAISMLAAWGDHWISRRGVSIRCLNLEPRAVAYAQRMGLFNFIQTDGLPAIDDHEEAGRFLVLRKVFDGASLTQTLGDIASILRSKQLIEVVQYVLSEMISNVLDHAQAEAMVCAQYYPGPKRVSIGIADCGVGILASMRRSWSVESDTEAIITALKPFVSGTTRKMYDNADNGGLGLFYARGLAKLSKEYFFIYSGTGAYRQLKEPSKKSAAILLRDPAAERHNLWGGLHPWRGTVVGIEMRGLDRSFEKVKQAIGAVATPMERAADARVRSRIQFT